MSDPLVVVRRVGMKTPQPHRFAPSDLHPLLDRYGQEWGGEDEYGIWVGTASMPLQIHRCPDDPPTTRWSPFLRGPVWVVTGYVGADHIIVHIRGPKRAALQFVTNWGTKDVAIEPA